jgi:hypothetical protein
MKCAICETQIDSVEEAIEPEWMPSFFEAGEEHQPSCPDRTESLFQMGKDGEIEVKCEHTEKMRFLGETRYKDARKHLPVLGENGKEYHLAKRRGRL